MCSSRWPPALSNAEIATTLSIEESTIKTHIEHVLAKLDARARPVRRSRGRPASHRC
jgi:ATP/maltotriose-dependent transcriptional regulator MalT